MEMKQWPFLIEAIRLKLGNSFDLLDMCKAMKDLRVELKDLFRLSPEDTIELLETGCCKMRLDSSLGNDALIAEKLELLRSQIPCQQHALREKLDAALNKAGLGKRS